MDKLFLLFYSDGVNHDFCGAYSSKELAESKITAYNWYDKECLSIEEYTVNEDY